MTKNIKIFICCTEQSGENIVYNICKKLNIYNYQIDGVCGSLSEKYFTNKYYDISLFKSLGLFEILFSIPKFLKIINNLSIKILNQNYDLVICVDSPDFNYQLAKKLKKIILKITLYRLLLLQFGHGEVKEQKSLLKFLMKFLLYLVLKINFLKKKV